MGAFMCACTMCVHVCACAQSACLGACVASYVKGGDTCVFKVVCVVSVRVSRHSGVMLKCVYMCMCACVRACRREHSVCTRACIHMHAYACMHARVMCPRRSACVKGRR
jgi:hypothetical protein